jgi:hypothetical protein
MAQRRTLAPDALLVARPVIGGMCNFFHAMLYADYIGCSQKLSKWKMFGIIA